MDIYNTLTKTKEKLIPRQKDKIQMFVCGPTVYDYIHIGNARTFVFFDIVAKYLRFKEYGVDYIQNITDIDDKIIAKAKENKRETLEYAKEYFEKFKQDMQDLGIDSPKYIPATEHIEQVIKQVKTLKDKGHAYLIEDDGWYFDLSTFKEYGKLSGRKAEMANDAVTRIDENDKKRNKGDFCLWKLSKEGPGEGSHGGTSMGIASEPSWDSELGKGRPGWHIEDTAITEHFFGPQYDIHGGGQDLIFPHHEAEITQQESASGKKPFVKYWIHVAFLINKEQKMSKSLGNFETVNDLLKKYPKEVLRFYLLSNHYRSPLDYSDAMFNQARAAISRISEFIQKLKNLPPNVPTSQVGTFEEIDKHISEMKEKIYRALDNDFNTPEAFASIFEFIKTLNPPLAASQISQEQGVKIINSFIDIDNIIGVIPKEQEKMPEDINALVEKREKLRGEKKYEESDKIRAEINGLGYEIEDTIYGPLAIKK